MEKNIKKIFFVLFFTTIVVMIFVSCSKKSDSSSKNENTGTYVDDGVLSPSTTEVKKDSYSYDTVATTSEITARTTTTSTPVYIASAINTVNNTTTTARYSGQNTSEEKNASANANTNQATNSPSTNKTTTSPNRTSTSSRLPQTTSNRTENTTTTASKKEDAIITTTSVKETTTTTLIKYTPDLYVETSPDITINSSNLNEIDVEVFLASATLWIQTENDLNNIGEVLNNIDCLKINVGERIDFNNHLKQNSIKNEDRIEYLASVLLFESSKAAQVQINENSFPELSDFYEDNNRLIRNNENLILTNNTKNALVYYVYVNSYSQSITVSCYATIA